MGEAANMDAAQTLYSLVINVGLNPLTLCTLTLACFATHKQKHQQQGAKAQKYRAYLYLHKPF